jgi:isocitrate/isopropylmalate dehydrogenase
MTRRQRAVFSGSIAVGTTANRNPNRRYPYPFESAWGSVLDMAGKGHPKLADPAWGGATMLEPPGFAAALPHLIGAP